MSTLHVHTAGDLVSFAPVASISIENGVAEIVAATPDGATLVYTDSDNKSIGLVDIINPDAPTITTNSN